MWTKRVHPRPYAVVSVFLLILLMLVLYTLRLALNRAKTKRVINILCFGDSLTAGSFDVASEKTSTPKRHPYSIALKKYFDEHVPAKNGEDVRPMYEVHTAGIPGERAVDQMRPRLKKRLRSSAIKYDWVIILGGTNDLRKYLNSSSTGDFTSIFNALLELHEIAHKLGGRTVAVTIPDRECRVAGTCLHLKKMQYQINEHLRDFAFQNKGDVVLADLAKEVVFSRDGKLFIDWVHFTPQGYDKMAEVIYKSMKEYV